MENRTKKVRHVFFVDLFYVFRETSLVYEEHIATAVRIAFFCTSCCDTPEAKLQYQAARR